MVLKIVKITTKTYSVPYFYYASSIEILNGRIKIIEDKYHTSDWNLDHIESIEIES